MSPTAERLSAIYVICFFLPFRLVISSFTIYMFVGYNGYIFIFFGKHEYGAL